MKLRLLQELLDLNRAFEYVLCGLERMEKVQPFDREQLRYSRAEVESARADANREFFDKFEELVNNDAKWSYEFRAAYDRKTKDPFDFCLEIKEREEARRKKGLLPVSSCFPTGTRTMSSAMARSRPKSALQTSEGRQRSKTRSANAARQLKTGVTRPPERKPKS